MAAKTHFTQDDLVAMLSQYDLGTYVHAEAIQQGTVQTNYKLQTSQATFVLRYYENRTRESVLFESDVLTHLAAHHYPCPAQLPNRQGAYVGVYRDKPYVLFAFCEGQTLEHPTRYQWQQLVQHAARLQQLTQHFQSPHMQQRWNYGPELCEMLAQAAALRVNTPSAHAKYVWHTQELAALELPIGLPKGICHCDFHFSNVLFKDDRFVALLDFDDANYTFLQFDLVGLIESWAWPYPNTLLDMPKARSVVQEYMRHRELAPIEMRHLFDVYKLSILFDCVWYFERGSAADCYERIKIEALNTMGRNAFYDMIFATS